ncbi:glucokinase [Lysobacter solisilvae (ex Woo and Kim 2022)]|uniref:Glucokinase n=1 Tax=Agrilutibacter terrestris TaxID=2865112 RepID=A0A7H0FTQ2_9GAMM|nr:glucokinase [Lysobacter terrestris]QNP39418.1 glucokinase [Lysobacter terrestris]
MSAARQRFVAADVGGTNARIALVQSGDDGRPAVLAYRRYPCGDYPGLGAILADFVAGHAAGFGRADFERMAIASAGVVLDGEVINSNLPWRIVLGDLRRELALRELHVINDFAAAAYGSQQLAPADSRLLTPGVVQAAPGPALVIGPGTGLGAAVCLPQPRGLVVLPSEAGMAAFAPGTAREIEVLRWLQRRGRHVATEQLLSGPGLRNLYEALCALDGTPPQLHAPAAISDAARRGDALAREAVLGFCALLGSVIGDLAMVSSAQVVHVAGGIVPQLADFLPQSDFRSRLVDKGAMRAVLERVPVWLIENERLGVIGAASWYLQHLRERGGATP